MTGRLAELDSGELFVHARSQCVRQKVSATDTPKAFAIASRASGKEMSGLATESLPMPVARARSLWPALSEYLLLEARPNSRRFEALGATRHLWRVPGCPIWPIFLVTLSVSIQCSLLIESAASSIWKPPLDNPLVDSTVSDIRPA
jgi:hypothetical protein